MDNLTDAQEKVVGAGIRLFFRYGVKRTTMNDLALEAGISRPTLYGAFANKEEVLCAVIRALADRNLAAIEAKVAAMASLSEKLDVAFKQSVLDSFDAINSSSDADDVVSGFNAAGKEEIAKSYERFRALIEKWLIAHASELRSTSLTHRKLSDFIQNAAIGCMYRAKDNAHLKELLISLKVLVLA